MDPGILRNGSGRADCDPDSVEFILDPASPVAEIHSRNGDSSMDVKVVQLIPPLQGSIVDLTELDPVEFAATENGLEPQVDLTDMGDFMHQPLAESGGIVAIPPNLLHRIIAAEADEDSDYEEGIVVPILHGRVTPRLSVSDDGFITLRNYKISFDVLGGGKLSEVRAAFDDRTGQKFAVKIFSKTKLKKMNMLLRASRNPVEEAYREAALLRRLSHENVIRMVDFIDEPDGDNIFLFLEFMDRVLMDVPSTIWKLKHVEVEGLRTVQGPFVDTRFVDLHFVDIQYVDDLNCRPSDVDEALVNESRVDEMKACHYSFAGSSKPFPLVQVWPLLVDPDCCLLLDSMPFRYSEPEAKKYFRDVLAGIDHLHSCGIVHRDLKPQNLLLSKENVVKIADFNFCDELVLLENGGEAEVLTAAQGTPAFTAPECLLPDKKQCAGRPLDMWGLGATLYVLVVGDLPYKAVLLPELFDCIVNDPVVFPEDVAVSSDLKNLILRLMEKNPAERANLMETQQHVWVTDR